MLINRASFKSHQHKGTVLTIYLKLNSKYDEENQGFSKIYIWMLDAHVIIVMRNHQKIPITWIRIMLLFVNNIYKFLGYLQTEIVNKFSIPKQANKTKD